MKNQNDKDPPTKEPTSEVLEAWRAWYQREQELGNMRTRGEIFRDRHGDDCGCDDCAEP